MVIPYFTTKEELGGARRGVGRYLLRVFEQPVVLQIGGDAGRAVRGPRWRGRGYPWVAASTFWRWLFPISQPRKSLVVRGEAWAAICCACSSSPSFFR